MAGAAISLIGALAPDLINLVVGLVHKKAPLAEATHGPNTGPIKFADVFSMVMGELAKAHAVGTISMLPDDASVKTVIQAVVASMKMSGLLTPVVAPPPGSPGLPFPNTPGTNSQTFAFLPG